MKLTQSEIRETANELKNEFIAQGCEEIPFDPTDRDGIAVLVDGSKTAIEESVGKEVDHEELNKLVDCICKR